MGLISYNDKQGMHVFRNSPHRRCCNQSLCIQCSLCSCELSIGLWPKKEWKARWESAAEHLNFYFFLTYVQLRYCNWKRKKIEELFQIGPKPVRLNYLSNGCEWTLASCFSPLMLGQVLGPAELLLCRIHASGWSWWLVHQYRRTSVNVALWIKAGIPAVIILSISIRAI